MCSSSLRPRLELCAARLAGWLAHQPLCATATSSLTASLFVYHSLLRVSMTIIRTGRRRTVEIRRAIDMIQRNVCEFVFVVTEHGHVRMRKP